MAGTQSQHTMYLNVVPGLLTGLSTLTAGLASINTQFQSITKSVVNDFSVLEGVITTATVLAIQFTKNMIDSYASFEQGMKIVQVVSNQSAEGLDYLKQKANEFSVQYRMDIDQITEGLQTLGRAGLNTASEQAEVLESGLQTAKLEGRELNTVLQEIIQNTALLGGDLKSDQFGEQSEYVNDLLVATSMTAPITTHDISETLKYSGGIAAAAGANIEDDEGKAILTDYMASIAAFAQKGVSGSIAGTALRAFFNKPATQDSSVVEGLGMVGLSPEDLWQDGGEKMKPISEQIGLIKKKMDDLNISTMDQLQIWSKIVGGKMGQQMMKLDSDDIKELTKDIKSADNASNLANASMKTYEATTKEIGESWEAIQRNIGEHAVRALQPIVTVIDWIAKALSNPAFGGILWMGIAILISRGLATIWKVIQSIKQDVLVFVDMLRGKVNMAQNEEITKLKENIAELKQKHADELEILALKKQELSLQQEINSATAIRTGQDGTRQVAWNAQQQAQFARLGISSRMGQVTDMMNAQLQSQNAFRIQSSLYKELQMGANASSQSMGNLVRWINEGMKDIEITADMTFSDLLSAVDELYGASNAATNATKQNSAATLEDADITIQDVEATRAEIAALQEELGIKGNHAEATVADAEATVASTGAVEEHTGVLPSYISQMNDLNIKFGRFSVVMEEIAAAMAQAEIAAQEAAAAEMLLVERRLKEMPSLWQNKLYMANAYSPYLANWNQQNAQAGFAANAAQYQRYLQMQNMFPNAKIMMNQATSFDINAEMKKIEAEAKRVRIAMNRSARLSQNMSGQYTRIDGELRKILMQKTKEASTASEMNLIDFDILETQMMELETERRMLAIRIESMQRQAEISGATGEDIALIEELQMQYRESIALMQKINNALARKLGLEENQVFETEQGVIIQGEQNIVDEEILVEKEAESLAQKLKTASTALGGTFGIAMIGLTVAMEAWMMISQKMEEMRQEIQEFKDIYQDSVSNLQSALDDYRNALKEAYPDATNAELEQKELDVFTALNQGIDNVSGDAEKIYDQLSDSAKLPQYEFNEDGTASLIEEELSSEQQTQNELDKNTKAVMRATIELNQATDAFVAKATGNEWVGADSDETWAAWTGASQNNEANKFRWGNWLEEGSTGTFRMSDEQKDENYVGSTEPTGLLLEDFKDANGNWIKGLRVAMGDSVEDFAKIIPAASDQLLKDIAHSASQMGTANNLRLQLSMRDNKKDWQALAKEIGKYESKNQKPILQAEKIENQRLNGYLNKIIAITGGGFSKTQILQMAYLQQMSDMLSVAKEQIMPVVTENTEIAAQNWAINAQTDQNVQGTGSSTYGTYANAAIIAAYVAQMAEAKAYEAEYNEGLKMDPNDPNLTPGQKQVAEIAHSSKDYQDFMKKVNLKASGSSDFWDPTTWGNFGRDDTALREVAKVYTAAAFQTVKGMSPSDATKAAEEYVDSNPYTGKDIMRTIAKNYTSDGFVKTIMGAYLASDMGEPDADDNKTGAGSGDGSGSGSDSDSDSGGTTKNRVDLVLCNKKEIPKLNVNLFKKEPSFTVLNKNFRVRDIKVNTQDKPKAILSSVKNAIIDVEKRTDPKIIQDEAGEYDPVAATEGNSTPTGKTNTQIDS